MQKNNTIIPIEVKSGPGTTLKSLHMFLDSHVNSPYGIRFSTQDYFSFEKIKSYPLYAIAHVVGTKNSDVRQSIEALFE